MEKLRLLRIVACGLHFALSACGVCQAADESITERGLTAAQLNKYVEQLSVQNRKLSDMAIRVVNSEIVFDVSTVPDPSEIPWIVQINLTDSAFRAMKKKYGDFELTIHRTITVAGKRYHSAVWAQPPEVGSDLLLPSGELPESGETGVTLQPLNQLMRSMLRDHNIPGATLAVADEQTVIFERGFGYSELSPDIPMAPDATMRIASLSKPITAVAVLLLHEDGLVDLDGSILKYLDQHSTAHFSSKQAIATDPRWAQITVRHLLQHSGGWDREKSRDTVFQLPEISKHLKLKRLARSNDIIKYQFSQPLDFDPGSEYAYSNVGYCILGRVIEAVAKQPYADFVTDRILTPCGMRQTRLARTRLAHRADDEVRYYTQKEKKSPAVWTGFDNRGRNSVEIVSAPYGMWDVEVMDSHGGWTSTSGDLLRFVLALENPEKPLLTQESRRLMFSPPSFNANEGRGFWYGCGWNVRNLDDQTKATYWHTGALAGTSTLMVHRRDGLSWVVLFNIDMSQGNQSCTGIIDPLLHRAVDESL